MLQKPVHLENKIKRKNPSRIIGKANEEKTKLMLDYSNKSYSSNSLVNWCDLDIATIEEQEKGNTYLNKKDGAFEL